MVPFELIYLQAILQVRLGHASQGVDHLYKMLSYCKREQQYASQEPQQQVQNEWCEGDAGAGCLPLVLSMPLLRSHHFQCVATSADS